jgi:hypothetical protein
MKKLTILERKIISDSQLSFSFFLNNVNYKKLKSLGKLQLLPHYVIFRFFHKTIKLELYKLSHKNIVQSNSKLVAYFPGHFLYKRMFYKNVQFLVETNKDLKNSYIWYNPSFRKIFNKSPFFNRINQYPVQGGSTILVNPIQFFPNNELNLNYIFEKNMFQNSSYNFNFFIFFNLALFQIKELYIISYMLILNNILKN